MAGWLLDATVRVRAARLLRGHSSQRSARKERGHSRSASAADGAVAGSHDSNRLQTLADAGLRDEQGAA